MNQTVDLQSVLSTMVDGLVEAERATDDPEIRVRAQGHLAALHSYRQQAVLSGFLYTAAVAPEFASYLRQFEHHADERAWSDLVAVAAPMLAALPGEPTSKPIHKPTLPEDLLPS